MSREKGQAATEYLILLAAIILLVVIVVSIVYFINAQQKSRIKESLGGVEIVYSHTFCGNGTWEKNLDPPEPCEYTMGAETSGLQCVYWQNTEWNATTGYMGETCNASCLCE